MDVQGIVIVVVMLTAGAVMSLDSALGKSVLYAHYRWQRRRRSRRTAPRSYARVS